MLKIEKITLDGKLVDYPQAPYYLTGLVVIELRNAEDEILTASYRFSVAKGGYAIFDFPDTLSESQIDFLKEVFDEVAESGDEYEYIGRIVPNELVNT